MKFLDELIIQYGRDVGVPDAIIRVNRQGTVWEAKIPSHARGAFGNIQKGECLFSFFQSEAKYLLENFIQEVFVQDEVKKVQVSMPTRIGVEYWVVTGATIGDDDLLLHFQNVTIARRAEQLRELAKSVVLEAFDEQASEQIFAMICRCIRNIYDYGLTWMGTREANGLIRIRAYSGEKRGFLDEVNIRWDDSPFGNGPSGLAAKTGQVQLASITDLDIAPWLVVAQQYGITKVGAVPLIFKQEVLGVLSLCSTCEQCLTEEILAEIESFCSEVAPAIRAALNREQLRLVMTGLESTVNATVITDVHGVIQWANPALKLLTGYELDEVYGKKPNLFKSGAQGAGFYKKFWDHILSGNIWHGEFANRKKDGSHYTEEMTVTPIFNEMSELVNFIAFKQDVTEKVLAQKALIESREKVARSERLAALGTLAAGVAHEINQPLNFIKVSADNALFWKGTQQELASDELYPIFKKISLQADRIAAIVRHIRNFLTNKAEIFEVVPCNLNDCIQDVLMVLAMQIEKHDVIVDVQLGESSIMLGNMDRLSEVFLNIIMNSIQAMSSCEGEKRLFIRTGTTKEWVWVEIRDTGEGIPSQIMSKIFDPYFSTKSPEEGLGLGLAIAQAIVNSHFGQIEVSNQAGAVFRVKFPIE